MKRSTASHMDIRSMLSTDKCPIRAWRRRTVCKCWTAMLLAIPALVSGSAVNANAQEVPPKSERAPEIRLAGETVSLPIMMVGEYPFIEGSVAGVKGKLMLDTGAEQALAINDHRVPVANGRTIGTGHFGSGETFAVRLVPELTAIRIGALHFARATSVQAQDARLLEGITPDFLGWLGHHAWAGYAMKLDYRASRATFYKGGPGAYLKGERVIAELPFETRKLPNHPLMPGRIGGMAIIAAWDTGQYGSLFTDAAGKAALLRSRHLTVSSDKGGAYDLAGLELAGHSLPVISAVEVETARSPAAAPIGISEPHLLTIGYGLLRQYKTVWDHRRRRIYLLAP